MIGKRIGDIILGVLAFALLIPLQIVLSLLIVIIMGRPILFSQRRPGKDGKPFTLYKYRSMNNCYGSDGKLLNDEQRLSKFGKIIRSISIDEIPSLYNVLKGEMSFVGPRPLLMQYLDKYTHEQMRRHEVRPGITGWAQVNGRNNLCWDEKFKLDVWYIDNMSFGLDMKILWMTLWKVLKRSDISKEGHATMEEFMGSISE